MIANAASVAKVEDHSLPRSKVRTYHVTCSNGRFGMVRLDTTVTPNTVCAMVQDGSKPEACLSIDVNEASLRVASAADLVCQ